MVLASAASHRGKIDFESGSVHLSPSRHTVGEIILDFDRCETAGELGDVKKRLTWAWVDTDPLSTSV